MATVLGDLTLGLTKLQSLPDVCSDQRTLGTLLDTRTATLAGGATSIWLVRGFAKRHFLILGRREPRTQGVRRVRKHGSQRLGDQAVGPGRRQLLWPPAILIDSSASFSRDRPESGGRIQRREFSSHSVGCLAHYPCPAVRRRLPTDFISRDASHGMLTVYLPECESSCLE